MAKPDFIINTITFTWSPIINEISAKKWKYANHSLTLSIDIPLE